VKPVLAVAEQAETKTLGVNGRSMAALMGPLKMLKDRQERRS
jgi:hypothetical protein